MLHQPTKLTELATGLLLKAKPPSISDLLAEVALSATYNRMLEKAAQLFPEQLHRLEEAETIRGKVDAFKEAFETTHFPLNDLFGDTDSWDSPLENLFDTFPFDVFGFTDEDIHEIWDTDGNIGLAAMLLLVDIDDLHRDQNEGIYGPGWANGLRTSWLEAAETYVDRRTLDRIPANGIPNAILAETLEGSGYEAVAKAAPWVFSLADNPFLYTTFEDAYQISGEDHFEPESIKALTPFWREAVQTLEEVYKLANRIDENPTDELGNILDHVLNSPDYKKDTQDGNSNLHTRL